MRPPAPLELRFRAPSPELLALPWRVPLAAWDPTTVSFRDVPVGPSRHLVRFVDADGRLWALKELPAAVANAEYDVLRELELRSLAAVRAAGVVVQPAGDVAILVTDFLEGSWQYRRLLRRVPISQRKHRERLLEGIAVLMVDLHRNGIFWGDCSLANTLFTRDGQAIQAWMVDAETSEIHGELSDGQRQLDLDILLDNVIGGLLDAAARLGEPAEVVDQLITEAEGVVGQYRLLWQLLHEEPLVALGESMEVEAHLRLLNEAGFGIDEVRLESAEGVAGRLRLKASVTSRNFHASEMRRLTGLEVGEGQATVLLDDLRAYQAQLREGGDDLPERFVGRRWLDDRFTPGVAIAHAARHGVGDPTQAYCDLLEVRWLLSEQAGFDVGDGPALEALTRRVAPDESAANLAIVDEDTREVPVLTRERLEALEQSTGRREGGEDADG